MNKANKMKIDVLFLVVMAVLVILTIILIDDYETKMACNSKDFSIIITNIIKQKNDQLNEISSQLAIRQHENADLRNTLADTRNKLEALTKNLAQPISGATPSSATANLAVTK